MADHDQLTRSVADSTSSASTTRRTLLKGFAAAGAAVSLSSKVAWADGEIGYWAKDLSNEKLIDMYTTILRIRWFERTLADKQLERSQLPQSDPFVRRPGSSRDRRLRRAEQ